MDFMTALENNEESYTENGAVGYKTSKSALVDLNFGIPSYRQEIDTDIFDKSMKEDKILTLKWLLFLRDIRQGVGERQSFRKYLLYLCNEYEDIALDFIYHIPVAEYGRWDDLVWLFCQKEVSYKVSCVIADKIRFQYKKDREDYINDRPISLLAKWLPSEGASSKVTKENARRIRLILDETPRSYRKTISALRKYLNIVERKMSEQKWDKIDYSAVPSKANLIYGSAFMRHDPERRAKYFEELNQGTTKINADALFLHDIIYAYAQTCVDYYIYSPVYNELYENLWKAQKKLEGFSNTLVVRDGSGSMCCTIPNSKVRAIDVANAITIYCSENNTGAYKNKFITFSSHARMVDLSNKKTLFDKLVKLHKYNDYSNTNIQNVFNLILETAIKNKIKQEDMPKNVLIVSDMEYDCLPSCDEDVLFEKIAEDYKAYGYKLPKLIFWNINSRTDVVPIQENENGVILLSGFSKNLMQMVMSTEIDPYKALVKILNTPRYECVENIFSC